MLWNLSRRKSPSKLKSRSQSRNPTRKRKRKEKEREKEKEKEKVKLVVNRKYQDHYTWRGKRNPGGDQAWMKMEKLDL